MAYTRGNNPNSKAQLRVSPGKLGGAREGAGTLNAETRDILRMGARQGAPLQAAIARGESPFQDVPDYTPSVFEIQKAFEICAKHSLPELEKVVEEKFCAALAEMDAMDMVEIETVVDGEKVILRGLLTLDCIQQRTDTLITKLTG